MATYIGPAGGVGTNAAKLAKALARDGSDEAAKRWAAADHLPWAGERIAIAREFARTGGTELIDAKSAAYGLSNAVGYLDTARHLLPGHPAGLSQSAADAAASARLISKRILGSDGQPPARFPDPQVARELEGIQKVNGEVYLALDEIALPLLAQKEPLARPTHVIPDSNLSSHDRQRFHREGFIRAS